MSRKLNLFFLIVFFLFLGAAQSVSAQDTATFGAKSQLLRVGVATDYPPLIFRKDGVVSGVESDLARKVGAALDREIQFVELPFGNLIPALRDERIDIIMSGMSMTPERGRKVAFVNPYMRVGQMALIRVRDAGRLAEAEALYTPGLKVGFKSNTTGEEFVRENLGEADPRGFGTIDNGLDALRTGRIDVFIHDAPTVWRVGKSRKKGKLVGLNRPLTKEYLAWAVRSDDLALKRSLDKLVNQWIQSGDLAKTINRWILVSASGK